MSAKCSYCFDVLINKFIQSFNVVPFVSNDSFPLFVTWIKSNTLRGCIGTFRSLRLDEGLKQFALNSALYDSRFPSVSLCEIPMMTCKISLLTDFEVTQPFEWEVGTHGIEIEFSVGRNSYRGTFLPEVAEEQGWTKEETLNHLIAKAGFNGSLQNALTNMKITRYQSKKASLSFDEYKKLRPGHDFSAFV